jgi:acyl-CoA synthetase (AMP-forming)/AMP-acid ligase II
MAPSADPSSPQPAEAPADPPPDPLDVVALATPDAVAVIVDPSGGAIASTTSYGELDRQVNQLVNGLRAHVRPGERLVWCGPNSLEVLMVIHGARKLGAVAVPLSYRFTAEEMAYVVDNADATCVIADAEYAPLLAERMGDCPKVRSWIGYTATVDAPALPDGFTPWADVLDGQPSTLDGDVADGSGDGSGSGAGGQMIYTSGTTGKPKGAMRSASDPALLATMLAELNYLHPNGVHLTTGPLYHSGPLAFATVAGYLGHLTVVMRRFDATRWVDLVREHRVTSTFTAPTQLKRIVSLPDDVLARADLSSMITLIANAAPVPYSLKQELIAKLGDGFLYEVYGSTELGVDCILKPGDQLRKPGSCGKPYGGIEVRIFDEDGNEAPTGTPGELFLRTTMAMDGYHRSSEQLAEHDLADGSEWKSVGDVAYVDDEGFVHICDRKKDMIISGGMNIYPAEVEAVLHSHPDVLDVAVFGIPSDEWGESVHAVVQPKPGVSLDLDALAAHAAEHLGSYKRPRSYEVRDELPRTDSGKLLKRVLRDEHWKGRSSSV